MQCCLLCARFKHTRGLCGSHYQQALKRIRAGRTTWPAEVAAGRALPPDTAARDRWHYGGRKKGEG